MGFRNYVYLFAHDPLAWQAARNTLWFVVILVPARMLAALFTSMLLVSLKRGGGLFRTVFYLPALAPPVAATIAFVFLFNPATGPVNGFLSLLGIDGPLWFDSPDWAKPSLVLLGTWAVGDLMVIFLAALLDVPKPLYEAAALDGANALAAVPARHAAGAVAGAAVRRRSPASSRHCSTSRRRRSRRASRAARPPPAAGSRRRSGTRSSRR